MIGETKTAMVGLFSRGSAEGVRSQGGRRLPFVLVSVGAEPSPGLRSRPALGAGPGTPEHPTPDTREGGDRVLDARLSGSRPGGRPLLTRVPGVSILILYNPKYEEGVDPVLGPTNTLS